MSSDTGKVPVTGISSAGGAVPVAANVLDGFQSFSATTAATTVITVPAGRTWIGQVMLSCACANAGGNAVAAQASAIVSTAGAGATPAAGNYLELDAFAGANVAAGTVGDQGNAMISQRMVVIAPGGNSVTVQVATTQAGTSSKVSCSAIGELQ